MSNRAKQIRLSEYRVSNIQETENNRLVDIGDTFLALLDEIPRYELSVVTEGQATEEAVYPSVRTFSGIRPVKIVR